MQDICVFTSCADGPDWQAEFQQIATSHGLTFIRMLCEGDSGRWAAEAEGTLSSEALTDLRASGAFDVNCLAADTRRKSLLIADMDSTIIRQESLDHLALIAGKGDEIIQITARAMAGELDFEAALDERLAMLAGQPAALLDQVIAETTITNGAAELVGTMRAHGAFCYLVSGGFTFLTAPIAAQLGFHDHYANDMLLADNRLVGAAGKPILDRDAKVSKLNSLSAAHGLTPEQAATIGDGANDLGMLQAAGLGVAFEGKPLLRAHIPVQLNHTDLTGLLCLQGYHETEFTCYQP